MAESLNRDWYAQLVGAIATARGKSEDQVRQLFDDGPLLAEDALGAGLVDGLAYQDELGELVPELGLDASDRIEERRTVVSARAPSGFVPSRESPCCTPLARSPPAGAATTR